MKSTRSCSQLMNEVKESASLLPGTITSRIAKTITTLLIRLPNGSCYTETLYTTPQQEGIKPLLDTLVHDARVG